LTLSVGVGEVHAIMGPNGSGKSTLSFVLAGREGYEITQGSILYRGADLTAMKPEERAAKGVFLAMQYPVEIPGVTTLTFLKTALNAQRRARHDSELDAMSVLKLVRQKASALQVPEEMLKRAAQCRIFRRREKAPRNRADGDSRTRARHPGRNRFRSRH